MGRVGVGEPSMASGEVLQEEGSARAETHQIAIISPCRDEELTLERTIASMRAQTHPPVRWIIVDDGSQDRTPQILDEAARKIPWLRIVKRGDRGFRKLGEGVIDSFYAGFESLDVEYDFIAKMDVDLEFAPRYLERILEHFERDPNLAAASGKVFRLENDRLVEEFMIDEMVAGPFKLYRREAFERIGGFVRQLMWDGIDFHRTRMAGYRTASLTDPELRIIHLRLMGSSDGTIYRGRLRWGRGQYFMGSSFLYTMASAVFRMREKPYGIGGILILAGYLAAAMQRDQRYEDEEFRKELRRWQRQRLVNFLRGKGAR